MSKQRLEEKVAIITGAASGIGEAAARLFAEHGAFVIIADIQDELGNRVAESIGLDKANYRHCDVSDEKQVAELVAYAIEKYGTLDIMYSNAGIMGLWTSIMDMDIDDYDRTLAVNLRGSVLAIKHAAQAMVAKQVRGSIICTGSVSTTLAGATHHPYTISKHGLLGLVRTAAYELGEHGIRVNCVSPYGLATGMSCGLHNLEPSIVERGCLAMANLKGIVLKAKHVAEAALFLASDESAYVSGHNLAVDGGVSIINGNLRGRN